MGESTCHVPILLEVQEARSLHGLRHDDHRQYRRFCTNKVSRLAKTLQFTHTKGTKGRYDKTKPLSLHAMLNKPSNKTAGRAVPGNAREVSGIRARLLLVPVYRSERYWAYAMECLSTLSEVGRRKHHAKKALEKAVQELKTALKLARGLKIAIQKHVEREAEAANKPEGEEMEVDEKDKDYVGDVLPLCRPAEDTAALGKLILELQCRLNYMMGVLNFETEHWGVAARHFRTCRSMGADISRLGSAREVRKDFVPLNPDELRCYALLADELVPKLEYCAAMMTNRKHLDDDTAAKVGTAILQAYLSVEERKGGKNVQAQRQKRRLANLDSAMEKLKLEKQQAAAALSSGVRSAEGGSLTPEQRGLPNMLRFADNAVTIGDIRLQQLLTQAINARNEMIKVASSITDLLKGEASSTNAVLSAFDSFSALCGQARERAGQLADEADRAGPRRVKDATAGGDQVANMRTVMAFLTDMQSESSLLRSAVMLRDALHKDVKGGIVMSFLLPKDHPDQPLLKHAAQNALRVTDLATQELQHLGSLAIYQDEASPRLQLLKARIASVRGESHAIMAMICATDARWKECVALLERATESITESLAEYEPVAAAVDSVSASDVDFVPVLRTIGGELERRAHFVRSLRCMARARAGSGDVEPEANPALLKDPLRDFDLINPVRSLSLPPQPRLVPCRPIFYDVASAFLPLPAEVEAAAQNVSSQQGVGGFFRSFLG
eukprot:Clim_evm2s149 gene=Clim_evmTU2s149